MTGDAGTDAAARRALGLRLARFLAGLERARRQPNRREAYHLRDALEQLQAEHYREAEQAMLKAERAVQLPQHVASLVATNEPVTVAQLRGQLDRILKAQG